MTRKGLKKYLQKLTMPGPSCLQNHCAENRSKNLSLSRVVSLFNAITAIVRSEPCLDHSRGDFDLCLGRASRLFRIDGRPTPSASGSNASCCSARARGEAGADSDYDVAVFLKDFAGVVEEMGPIAEIEDRHPDGRRRRDQRASPAGRRIP